MRDRFLLGVAMLVVAAVIVGVLWPQTPLPPGTTPTPALKGVSLKGLACGSKQGLLVNDDVRRILKERYQIDKVDCLTTGSDVCGDAARLKDQDFVWPAGLYFLEKCQQTLGHSLDYDVTFVTPIVLYSWDCVTDELVRRGQVTVVNGVYYIPDMQSFTKSIIAGTPWQGACGLLNKRMVVIPTDPVKSASGLEFVALLAGMLNGGETVDEHTIMPLLPNLKKYIDSLGILDETSAKLFANCRIKGMGACPIFTVYESLGIDFLNQYPAEREDIISRFRILYPQPTMLADHEIIALTPNGKRFMQAMKDKEIQAIAWKNHGFRTGSLGVSDPSVFPWPGVPAKVEAVMDMPRADVQDCIRENLAGHNCVFP